MFPIKTNFSVAFMEFDLFLSIFVTSANEWRQKYVFCRFLHSFILKQNQNRRQIKYDECQNNVKTEE